MTSYSEMSSIIEIGSQITSSLDILVMGQNHVHLAEMVPVNYSRVREFSGYKSYHLCLFSLRHSYENKKKGLFLV